MNNPKPILVDKQNGDYKSILAAVQNAQPNTEIRIASGLYTDNVEITVPGLRLVPKDKEADIIWVARVGPAVLVNIPGDGKVYMNNLKLAHTSISVPVKDETNQKMNDLILHAFAADLQDKTHSDDKDPNASFAKCLDTHDKMNTLIYVKRGRIEITVDYGDSGLDSQP